MTMDYLLERDGPEQPVIDSSWMLTPPPASEVLSFPTISLSGLEFIQIEADAWVDGALNQSHGGTDEVFVQVSDNLRLIDGSLNLGDTTIATFNKHVHLEQGAYGMVLTDG